MKIVRACVLIIVALILLGLPQAASAGCAPRGKLHFVCGPKNVEDLVLVPGTHWIIASGLRAPGHIQLIDADAKTWRVLYPTDAPHAKQKSANPTDCPGPPAPAQFVSHGLNIRRLRNGLMTLYSINHGQREAVEFFGIDAHIHGLTLTWTGCAVMPKGSNPNSVAVLPDGGLLVTSFLDEGKTFAQMFSGQHTGEVYEWHPNTGFRVLPNTELAGDNGIEISRDGKHFYVAATGTKTVTRYSLPVSSAAPTTVSVDFAPDNLRWRADGRLLVAGRATELSCGDIGITPSSKVDTNCPHGLEVATLDPETMKVQVILREKTDAGYTNIAGSLQIGHVLWLASAGSDRVAYLTME